MIPTKWKCSQLGSKVQTFSGGTPSRNNKSFYNGNIFWIKSGELNSKYITGTNEKITEDGLNESSAKYVEPDTLLYALYGATAGIPAFTQIKATINQAVLAIIPNKDLNSVYLYFWFINSKEKLLNRYTQGGQPNLSANLVKEFNLPIPTSQEQKRIADILSACDDEINELQQIIDQYKEQKRGLMQQLLTGKKRVKVGKA